MLKRKSHNPLKRAKERADSALQASYRLHYPNARCEACGAPARLMHHHLLKSMSLYARYCCPANLIFLCEYCHNQIHFYNNNPVAAYSIKRGKNWQTTIYHIARQPAPFIGIKRCKEIIEYYQNNKPDIFATLSK